MPKLLRDTSLVPPPPINGFRCSDGRKVTQQGQYWLYVEATDAWLFGGDFGSLVEKFRGHLIVNEQPVPADLEGEVSRTICTLVDPRWKGCGETGAVPGKANLVTWGQMKRWLRTMIAWSKDRELVPQEEAERRAATCLQCRLHTSEANCRTGGCGGSLAGFLTQLAIHRSTPMDEQLHACGVCGCALVAMCHFTNSLLDRASAGLEYPIDIGDGQKCWRRNDA